jgi:hypothetical protein
MVKNCYKFGSSFPSSFLSMAQPSRTALVTLTLSPRAIALEDLATQFFQQCAGRWRSRRRYYTLSSDDVQEVVSDLEVVFLGDGDPLLSSLSALHELPEPFLAGAQVHWCSHYQGPKGKTAEGETTFGIRGGILYRDRGFATSRPVTATYDFPNLQTMVLRTEYGGSVFEEECRLVGDRYRTRQTIISRAGEEVMIGQYLENRLD